MLQTTGSREREPVVSPAQNPPLLAMALRADITVSLTGTNQLATQEEPVGRSLVVWIMAGRALDTGLARGDLANDLSATQVGIKSDVVGSRIGNKVIRRQAGTRSAGVINVGGATQRIRDCYGVCAGQISTVVTHKLRRVGKLIGIHSGRAATGSLVEPTNVADGDGAIVASQALGRRTLVGGATERW